MAVMKGPRPPEETVEILARQVREGSLSRTALLRELMRLGLQEQRKWKAIHYARSGRVDLNQAAEIAGIDVEGLKALLRA